MSDPNTIRILSFDGGGERGYLSMQFFQRFIQLWGIDQSMLAKKFDVICGTSIGGIIALALAFGKPIDEIMPFFTVQGRYIFSLTSLSPSVRPNLAAKVALIITDTPFYQSSGPTELLYGSGLLKATIEDIFTTNTLQNLQTNVIIPSYQLDTNRYVLFSNFNYPDFIGQNELISNVALATSAAPAYLPSLSLNGHTYIDGGVYQNNASSFGRTLAEMIKPNATRCCVLSIGTGLGELGFDPGNPSLIDPRVAHLVPHLKSQAPLAFDTIDTLFSLFEIAETGGQESIAKNLFLNQLVLSLNCILIGSSLF